VKRVYSSFNRAAAHHAKNLLEAEGIRAVVRNEFLSSAMGELPPAECQMEVWVLREEDAERADLVLKNSFSPKAGPPWKCSSCGENCEGQFTQCWRCGAYRAA
jgi:hypothetical protein